MNRKPLWIVTTRRRNDRIWSATLTSFECPPHLRRLTSFGISKSDAIYCLGKFVMAAILATGSAFSHDGKPILGKK